LTADASSDADVERVVGQAKEFFGSIDVVVYNAAAIRADKPTDLSAAEHRKLFEVNVLGALRLARLILPHPATEHTTTFLLTGGMPVAKSSYTSLSMGKAALRALTHALVEEYATERVRIGMITIDGAIAPGSRLDPDLIAEEYWRFHSSPTIPWYQELVMKP
jgi:NAD(P)-dependent dehydrogenase (short-subunit alcohol dehydrogenase family)